MSAVLQAPGAGLPFLERVLVRYLIFPIACRRLDWNSAAQLFEEEGRKVLVMWDSVKPAQIDQRVLIPR